MAQEAGLFLSEPDPLRGNASKEDITVQDIAVEIVAILERTKELERTLDGRYALAAFGLIERHQRSCDALKKRFADYAVELGATKKATVSRRRWPIPPRPPQQQY